MKFSTILNIALIWTKITLWGSRRYHATYRQLVADAWWAINNNQTFFTIVANRPFSWQCQWFKPRSFCMQSMCFTSELWPSFCRCAGFLLHAFHSILFCTVYRKHSEYSAVMQEGLKLRALHLMFHLFSYLSISSWK